MSTVDVQIVRPKKTGPEYVSYLVGVMLGYFVSALFVSWAAARVSGVPDFGYLEAVALVIGVRYLLSKPSDYPWWSKGPKA